MNSGWTVTILRMSALLAGAGVVFLAGMFAAFAVGASSAALALGRVNDVLVMLSYLLALPGVFAVSAFLRGRAATAMAVVVGTVAIGAIVILQLALVLGVLTFEEQVGPVSIALLVLGAWFVVTGHLGSRAGTLPRGAGMGLVAATYIGYPVWAFWVARRLSGDRRRVVSPDARVPTEA